MKIKEVLKFLISEEIANKKLANELLRNWSQQSPDITPDEVEFIYNEFQKYKNQLSNRLPQVISFLSRFDGTFGFSLFKEENLRDITKYTYNEIKSLLSEYTPWDLLEDVEEEEIFNENGTPAEKLAASKELWFGSRYCILNINGFRVYDIPDHSTSSKFGYYQKHLTELYGGGQWCVTYEHSSSYWQNYRNGSRRSFYFIIDENKGESDQYFISALQYDPTIHTKYRITARSNGGADKPHYWDEKDGYGSKDTVLNIYPKLQNYKNLIADKPYTKEELEKKSVISIINERPSNPHEFRRQTKDKKKAYIINGGILTKADSWRSMDSELRNEYIRKTERHDYIARFGNYEFLNEIKKVGVEINALNQTLEFRGISKGVSALYEHLIGTEFAFARRSKDSQYLSLMISKITGKFGLFSSEFNDWYRSNGITYEPTYKRKSTTAIKDDKNIPYMVELYSKSDSIDDKSFYTLIPVGAGSSTKAHLLSKNSYDAMLEKMTQTTVKDKTVKTLKDFNPETDVDLKEIKGVE